MSDEKLSTALKSLADIEDELDECDKKVQNYRLSIIQPIYEQRNASIKDVTNFWKVALGQHEDFADYFQVEDLKYIDTISAIEIQWESMDVFEIKFEFNGIPGDFAKQTVVKKFKMEYDTNKIYNPEKLKETELEDMHEFGYLTSEPCDVEWPVSYNSINPMKIMDKSSPNGKKNYRKGMKSIFGWFKWTGLKIGKEFPNGSDLATLFTEDIYPHCLKYYTQAHRDLDYEKGATDSEDEEDTGLVIPGEEEEEEEEGEEKEEPPKKKTKSS